MEATNKQAAMGEVCIPNIGPKERQKRLMVGIAGFAAGVVAFVLIQSFTLPVWANVFTLPFFIGGAFGFFQWKDKTCVKLVREGVMNMDDGDTPVTDAEIKNALARQARSVQTKSLVAGVCATLFCVFLSVI
jgi:hypothetical protein